jgi:hypothetical protein
MMRKINQFLSPFFNGLFAQLQLKSFSILYKETMMIIIVINSKIAKKLLLYENSKLNLTFIYESIHI